MTQPRKRATVGEVGNVGNVGDVGVISLIPPSDLSDLSDFSDHSTLSLNSPLEASIPRLKRSRPLPANRLGRRVALIPRARVKKGFQIPR
jgi:hypothetical protein